MISKLQNPVVTAALALMLSIGLGSALVWRTLDAVAAHALAARPRPPSAELKTRGWDFWTVEMENLSTELKEERGRLRKQADSLEQRAGRIAAEERELAKVRLQLEGLRKEIDDKVIEIAADETKNLRALAQTYANLTPRAVVAIFKEMDDRTAVKILSLMKADIVGPIFEEMSHTAGTDGPLAKRAAVLSEKLRLMKSARQAASS